ASEFLLFLPLRAVAREEEFYIFKHRESSDDGFLVFDIAQAARAEQNQGGFPLQPGRAILWMKPFRINSVQYHLHRRNRFAGMCHQRVARSGTDGRDSSKPAIHPAV